MFGHRSRAPAIGRLLAALLSCSASALALNCSALNASAIKLITFDVFAALADLTTSLTTSVEQTIPGVSASTASNIVTSWIGAYGGYAGQTFGGAATTGGLQPFPYVLRLGLNTSLIANGYSSVVPGSAEFERLATAWGNLSFWPGTAATLAQLSSAGYFLAPLSNGDRPTLVNATRALLPGAPMHTIFSSDRPVGAFKPATAMYAQLLQNFSVHEVLHIAGATADATGARAYGLLAGQNVRAGTLPSATACFVIPNITLLPALLNVSASATGTRTASGTPSGTSSGTHSRTPTQTRTNTETSTGSPARVTASVTQSASTTALQSATASVSPTKSPGGAVTPTETQSPGVTGSDTPSPTDMPPASTWSSASASQTLSGTASASATTSSSGRQPAAGLPSDGASPPLFSQGALAGAIIATLIGGLALGALAGVAIATGRISLAWPCRRRRPVLVKAWNASPVDAGMRGMQQTPQFIATELPGFIRKAQRIGGTSV